jgi:hypothetical protein
MLLHSVAETSINWKNLSTTITTVATFILHGRGTRRITQLYIQAYCNDFCTIEVFFFLVLLLNVTVATRVFDTRVLHQCRDPVFIIAMFLCL